MKRKDDFSEDRALREDAVPEEETKEILSDEDEIFASIQSGILSDADAQYNRELGSAVAGGAYEAYEYERRRGTSQDPDGASGGYEDDEDYEDSEAYEEFEDGEEDDADYGSPHGRGGSIFRKKDGDFGSRRGHGDSGNADRRKKGRRIGPDLAASGKKLQKGVGRAANTAKKGAQTAVNILFFILKWASGALMLAVIAYLCSGFWKSRSVLGSVTGFIYEKNYAEEAYLIGSACMILFALIQLFWIMSAQRELHPGMRRRIDTGRGLFAFAFYLVLGIVSGVVAGLLPSQPSFMSGVRQVFSVMGELPKTFLVVNLAGIVLCLLRRLGRRA